MKNGKLREGIENINNEDGEYICTLEELMFIVSHQIRHSIANITGLIELLNKINLDQESIEIFNLMKQEAKSLDVYTKKMTSLIHRQRRKEHKRDVDLISA